MGSVIYKRLFNTRIVHDFYVDYFSKNDLVVVPTIETEQMLKNSGMQFRIDDVGFRILYKVDDLNNAFISFKNVGLVFALTLKNIGFLNFTDLDDNTNPYESGKIAYFTNRTSVTTNDLDYDLLDYLKPKIFSYQFPQTGTGPTDMGHIKITNQANVDVTSQLPSPSVVAPDTMNRYFYAADFTKLPSGLYTFETWTDSVLTPTQKRKIYIDNNLARQGVFGIVDILAMDDNPANYPPIPGSPGVPPITDPAVYNMRFTKRNSQWKYIVVLKSFDPSQPAPAIGIVDNNPSQPVYGTLSFNPSTDTTVNGIAAKIITSTSNSIPFYEAPKTGLTIVKDPNTSPVDLISDISGVSPDLVSPQKLPVKDLSITEIFVYI